MAKIQQTINMGKADPQPGGREKVRVIHGKTQGDALDSAVRRAAGAPQDAAQSHASGQESSGTQSAASLSRAAATHGDDGRFTVAEEQNLDQQSDHARRIGQMPEGSAAMNPADALAKSMQPGRSAVKK